MKATVEQRHGQVAIDDLDALIKRTEEDSSYPDGFFTLRDDREEILSFRTAAEALKWLKQEAEEAGSALWSDCGICEHDSNELAAYILWPGHTILDHCLENDGIHLRIWFGDGSGDLQYHLRAVKFINISE